MKSNPLHGYALADALILESQDVQRDDRAELMRQAAEEIKRLIQELNQMRRTALVAKQHAILLAS